MTTPLFGAAVPVRTHPLADPGKGTGIAMVCTFGDTADVTWWRDLDLDTRPLLGPDGRLLASPPPGITSQAGRAAYRGLAGATLAEARTRVTALAAAAGDLLGEPEPVVHPVKFYEKGDTPLEIITTRQWYLRSGGRDPQLREALLARGREISWHPAHMRTRYENWVNGLSGDWPVSRQRFSGVPIPVWYPLDGDGLPRYDAPIVPDEARLPADPAAEPPPGYADEQRGQPGGFAADPDVLDTWATSSLTPQIAARAASGPDLDRIFPMDLRPQAHEIIRTWLFYTVLRAHEEYGVAPWRHAAISGWILDTGRKKMSKSRGNVVTPMDSLRKHGSDAMRYWAASGRLGTDMVFDPAQLRVGRRLAIKLLNASRFVLSLAPAPGPAGAGGGDACEADQISEPLDRGHAGPAGGRGGRLHHGVRVLRSRPGPARDRVVLLVLLRRLPRTGQVPRLRRTRPPPRRLRQSRPPHRPLSPTKTVRPVPPLRHRRVLVLVPPRLHPPLPLAHPRRAKDPGQERRPTDT